MRQPITCLASSAILVLLASSVVRADEVKGRSKERSSFSGDLDERSFWVSGTVVSDRADSLLVRIDDHGHNLPFGVDSKVKATGLAAGSRVNVRYHPTGSVGQTADEVQVVSGPHNARLR